MWGPLVNDWYGWWTWWIPLWMMFYWTIAKGCSSEATRERERETETQREREREREREHDWISQQSLNLTHNWKENGFTYPVLKFIWHFCIIFVQVLCDKVWGEGGEPKYDFVWYGGREGLEKGQIVLHNTWTAPKQSWNTHETAMKHCWNTTPPWVSNIPKLKLEHFWEKKMRKYHQNKERGCQIDSFYFLVIYSS